MARKRVTDESAVVAAAARLFEERGYRNTTIQDIADHLGIAKPTIYAHVQSKSALLEAIFEKVLSRIRNQLEEIAGSREDPIDELRDIIEAIILISVELRPYFLIFFGDERELEPRTRKRFRLWAREINALIEGVLQRAVQAGDLAAGVDPRIAANLLLGMVTSVMRWYRLDGPSTPADVTQQVLTLLGGLRTPVSTIAS